ncbi:hypothetical protein, partial [Caldilinea sp.]|uniref:hypothetical protein n=1 Tax=Caldilinea sp. TaxID=2293560 RepID=UPI002BBC5B33|nr:hypothetical protein [Caldilinea sp.]
SFCVAFIRYCCVAALFADRVSLTQDGGQSVRVADASTQSWAWLVYFVIDKCTHNFRECETGDALGKHPFPTPVALHARVV